MEWSVETARVKGWCRLVIEYATYIEWYSMMCYVIVCVVCVVFFFNDTATTEIYTLSLHDALPISVVKLYTGKKSIEVISELLECMGGAGYLEDTGIPTLLRDAQVLSIWEGTTNVLSLDVLRSIHRENTFESFLKISRDKINRIPINLELEKGILEIEIQKLEDYYGKLQELDQQLIETDARQLSFAIAKVMISILLVEFTNKINDQKQKARMAIITERWLDNNKVELKPKDVDYIMNSRAILGNE